MEDFEFPASQGSLQRSAQQEPNVGDIAHSLHGSDFAKLPLSAGLRWLIEFPPEWAWFLSWFPGQVPEHFKDHSRAPAQSSPSMPASSSTAASSTSLTTPGSSVVFSMPSQPVEQVAGATSKASSMATAAPAAVNAPTSDRPPQCQAPPVPIQQAASVPPTAPMTSSSTACAAASTSGSVQVSLPTPLPQPPMPSWQLALPRKLSRTSQPQRKALHCPRLSHSA